MSTEEIRKVIDNLMSFDKHIKAVIIATVDGLEYLTVGDVDGESLSAISAVIFAATQTAGDRSGMGMPSQVIIRFESGYFFIKKISGDLVLCVVSSAERPPGHVFLAEIEMLEENILRIMGA